MISLMDIVTAMEQLLTEQFPDEKIYRNLTPVDYVRPSFLIETGPVSVEQATSCTVELTTVLTITGFVEVDDYHHSQVEQLMDRLNVTLGLLCDGYLLVGDRALHVVELKGNYEYDFFTVIATLSYHDDREMGSAAPVMRMIQTKLKEV